MKLIRVKSHSGFSLIELMIAVAILAIIAVIAIPNYQQYVRKARRADAMEILSSLAHEQERYFTSNGQYDIALNGTDVANASDFYTVSFTSVTANAFSITATAKSAQASDTDCDEFTIDNLFQRQSKNSSGEFTSCWDG